MTADILVGARQAVALLTHAVGWPVSVRQLENVVLTLVEVGHLDGKHDEAGARLFGSDDLDLLTGELIRRRAPWTRRALIDRGFRAWVTGMPDVGDRVCLLPWWTDKGVWGVVDDTRRPETVEAVEWPTGRVTGVLMATGAVSGGLPVYQWRAIAAETATEGKGGVLIDASELV